VCKTRLRQPLFCPACGRVVERSEVVKGYEDGDGSYVLLDQQEVKKLAPESARMMQILSFVKESEIDPSSSTRRILSFPIAGVERGMDCC
jgi:DNA end-binding protein Ku